MFSITRHRMKPGGHSLFTALVITTGLFAVSKSSLADNFSLDPIPTSTYAIFAPPGSSSFDPVTHVYMQSGTIQALQFPDGTISTTDALILAQAVFSISETVLGGVAPPADPTEQILNATETISVGGTPLFSELIAALQFSTTYITPGTTYQDWQSTTKPEILLSINPLSSTFLAGYSPNVNNDVATIATATGASGTKYEVADSPPAPAEPASWLLLLGSLPLVLLRLRSHRKGRD